MNGDLLTRVINVTNHLLLPGWSSEYCSLRGDKNKPLGEEHDMKNDWLVVWKMTFIFPSIWNVIIPTDFHICQRGWNHQPEDVRFSTRGKGFQKKATGPPLQFTIEIPWNPELLWIAWNFFRCHQTWLENLRILEPEAWSQNPNFLTVMMSRHGFPETAVSVGEILERWESGKTWKFWENMEACFFSDGNMSVSFSYPKKVSESVSYFIYGDNHYQIWIKLVVLEHPTFSDPD